MGSKLIFLIVVVLGVVAIAQLVRLYELSSKLRKRGEHEISNRDNRLNAKLMLAFMFVFFGSMIYLMVNYGWTGRGVAATEHGERLDWLMSLNMIIVLVVFFSTNFLLFLFAFKYVKKPGVRALYFPHSTKLELIWTIVPAMALLVIIVLGLIEWDNATSKAKEDAIVVELYSKQFDWTARYSGKDNTLGKFDYKVTSDKNLLGIVNSETLDYAIDKLKNDTLLGIDAMERNLNNKNKIYSVEEREKMMTTLHRNEEIYRLLVQLKNRHDKSLDAQSWDDIIVAGPAEKLYLCVDQEYEFNFRSKDVIHSAFFPNFRAQMNTVPGQTTRFKFTPNKTTAEMRKIKNDPKFDYSLLCNKICGGSHYKMYMLIEVLERDEYNAVMKAIDLGSDNATRPKDDQLTEKELTILKKKFGDALPAAHRFETLFKGAPAPAVAPVVEGAEGMVAPADTAQVAAVPGK
ncbi:cytochrome c oxidase subunit II [Crocinitomicaceae bacterium CZZ-1]|uniref:cytochrome-c oxidase n=1 Tax=Taishania pollutisoli TaxID=2766479 RepID=A0A8J6P4C1_9FLAO|nr:cytochrome c oxidase subunit II [Taishania pollutisoli]MBC9811314.1 cytochrome c oxidase subunit II [Taishania pollutisoli]MBX2947771.1 cytochrome c oxidase subunit II [Crocinitomicaceae bacterium]